MVSSDTDSNMPKYPSIIEGPRVYNRCQSNCSVIPRFNSTITQINVKTNPTNIEEQYISIRPTDSERQNIKLAFKHSEYTLDKILVFFGTQHKLESTPGADGEIHLQFTSSTISSYAGKVTLVVQYAVGTSDRVVSDFLSKITEEIKDGSQQQFSISYQMGFNMGSFIPDQSKYFFYKPQSIEERYKRRGSSKIVNAQNRSVNNFYVVIYESVLGLDRSVVSMLKQRQKIQMIPNDNSGYRNKIYYSNHHFGSSVEGGEDKDTNISLGNGYTISCERNLEETTGEDEDENKNMNEKDIEKSKHEKFMYILIVALPIFVPLYMISLSKILNNIDDSFIKIIWSALISMIPICIALFTIDGYNNDMDKKESKSSYEIAIASYTIGIIIIIYGLYKVYQNMNDTNKILPGIGVLILFILLIIMIVLLNNSNNKYDKN